MKYTRSMLRGFDKESAKHIANVLHIDMSKKKRTKIKRKVVRQK